MAVGSGPSAPPMKLPCSGLARKLGSQAWLADRLAGWGASIHSWQPTQAHMPQGVPTNPPLAPMRVYTPSKTCMHTVSAGTKLPICSAGEGKGRAMWGVWDAGDMTAMPHQVSAGDVAGSRRDNAGAQAIPQ